MRNRLVIFAVLAVLALAGLTLTLSLVDQGRVAPKQRVRAQRIQGVNVLRSVSFTLKTTNTPVAVPAASTR
jgi:hypothetical protein